MFRILRDDSPLSFFFRYTAQEERASRKRFFVFNTERTNGAHQALVDKLKRRGHVEVSSVEDCHYCLAFCPIASRVGTDVGEALDRIPPKPTVLVVMHHTFDQNHIVADSSRLVNQSNVRLTVDVLFYQDKLLDSKRNDTAWSEIQRCLGLPDPEVPFLWRIISWLKKPQILIITGGSLFLMTYYTFPWMYRKIVGLPTTYMIEPKAKTFLAE